MPRFTECRFTYMLVTATVLFVAVAKVNFSRDPANSTDNRIQVSRSIVSRGGLTMLGVNASNVKNLASPVTLKPRTRPLN